MSIYQKFIDSAKKNNYQRQQDYEERYNMTQVVPIDNAINAALLLGDRQRNECFAHLPNEQLSLCCEQQQFGSTAIANNQHPWRAASLSNVQQQNYTKIMSAHYDEQRKQRNFTHTILQTCSPYSNRIKSSVKINYMPHANERTAMANKQQQQTNSGKKNVNEHHWLVGVVDDPVLLKWMQAMRFDTELECLTALQARTLAIDEHSAGALSVRNSQVFIQEMRLESRFIMELVDHLIELLPIHLSSIERFSTEFSELWSRLTNQTSTSVNERISSTVDYANINTSNTNNRLTIINCTPRKSARANARTLKPLDKLAVQIRNVCFELASLLQEYHEQGLNMLHEPDIDNGQLEASLRRIKEYYGKFVEISIRAECANIVRALDYDFSNSTLNRLSSSASMQLTNKTTAQPYESSCAQLPLKWALIALWQLTKDDPYLCRTLTERWQTASSSSLSSSSSSTDNEMTENVRPRARTAKRLDYCCSPPNQQQQPSSLRSDYEKLFEICQNNEDFRRKQAQLDLKNNSSPQKPACGALSSALKNKHEQSIRQVSTIELLIDIIISQPNRHERLDVMNFIHSQANKQQLIDIDELDQTVSAAIYTSNQYKVAALRILNHLCVNERAIKTILKCFSTTAGSNNLENKIIKSIFESYQTAQEHIYQNEIMFNKSTTNRASVLSNRRNQFASTVDKRKRARQLQRSESGASDEYSDYGSRQTNSRCSSSQAADIIEADTKFEATDCDDDEGDDAVVKEAIRLLIRLTTPFHSSNQGNDFYTLIGQYSINSLVKYLTNIIKSTLSREMLLLALSTLANISFITTEPMKVYGSNRIILELFRASKLRSKDLELIDQAVTIIANGVEKNLMDIVVNGGLTFLLSCLEVCPTRMANYKHHNQQLHAAWSSSTADELETDNVDYRSLHEYADVFGGDTCSLGSVQSRGSYRSKSYYATIADNNKSRARKPIILGSGDDVGGLLDDVLECACDNQQSSQLMCSSSSGSMCLSRLTANELAALERIHQKAAVAFARMSSDPVTTKMVLKYGGVKQMIDLCKYDHKRNYSDTVLMACVAALRKISTVLGSEIFRNYNALDLIELDPRHALKIYGNAVLRDTYASEV